MLKVEAGRHGISARSRMSMCQVNEKGLGKQPGWTAHAHLMKTTFLSPYKRAVISMSQGERNESSPERSHPLGESGGGKQTEIQAALAQFPWLSPVSALHK